MAKQKVSGSRGQKKTRKKRSRYAKIPLKAKLIFFRKVIHEKGDLRDIAKRLGIKYSTAKTLARNYKAIPEELNTEFVNTICEEFDRKTRPRKRCGYRIISGNDGNDNPQERPDGENEDEPMEHGPKVSKIQIISQYTLRNT